MKHCLKIIPLIVFVLMAGCAGSSQENLGLQNCDLN